MTVYVDVGVTGIQAWLGRSTKLAERRGASALLTDSTAKSRWDAIFADWSAEGVPITWASGAGDVAGVVSAQLPDADNAESIVTRINLELRGRMEHATFAGLWGSADSYVQFRTGAAAGRAEVTTRSFHPALREFPLAASCEACRRAPAPRTEPVCSECLSRRAYGRSAAVADGVRPVRDFKELAAVGHSRARDTPTRLCTIYADGNAVGQFMEAVVAAAGPVDEVSALLDQATRGCVGQAATLCRDTREEPPRLGLVTHLIGGDDVLVTVSAAYAWAFTVAFMSDFRTLFRDSFFIRQGGEADHSDAWQPPVWPTMSAGMVFHHYSLPIDGCIEVAERRMKQAKLIGADEAADAARIAWADLTAESADPTQVGARSLAWISDRLGDFHSLGAEWEPTHRRGLQALLSSDGAPELTSRELLGRVTRSMRKKGTLERAVELLGEAPSHDAATSDVTGWLDALRWALVVAQDSPRAAAAPAAPAEAT